jgi:2-oxoglutarate ferredoxin oxidoreductase subunit beta
MHSIHGRAPAIATGLAMTRPDLAVFVATGDGDALSIGGNHLIHALRRNINITILLFNNRIYGLTKGQFSPTSEQGKVTKSSPMGSLEVPFNPLSLAIGAEATFVARAVDSDRAGLTEVLTAATEHRGASFVEIYQNCPIFNDGAYDAVKGRDADDALIRLVHGEPILYAGGSKGVVRDPATGELSIVEVDAVGLDAILVHDAHREDPAFAFSLSRLSGPGVVKIAPVGIFRDVDHPAYDDLARQQLASAGPAGDQKASLQALLRGAETWTVL